MLRTAQLHRYRGWRDQPRRQICSPQRGTEGILRAIRREADVAKGLSDELLSRQFTQLRSRVAGGDALLGVDVVTAAFGFVAEALRRVHAMVYYDVQLVGGLALTAGSIAEIQTGEGKTIVTALPAAVHALVGEGVHVATTNEYLSSRDFETLRPVFGALGLTSGLLKQDAPVNEKRAAYQCDITYGPGYEFGFDYLKDQLAIRSRFRDPLGMRHLSRLRGYDFVSQPTVQRGQAFAIVDEADSVLIDEANTPLILSGAEAAASSSAAAYQAADHCARRLAEGDHYRVGRSDRSITWTEEGAREIHRDFERGIIHRIARPWSQLVQNALRARRILARDVDYVVRDGEVHLVDPNTGRIHDERTWRGGLHQAVEIKEGLDASPETITNGRITRQRFLKRYRGLCGLTGTIAESHRELNDVYELPVVRIPTHRPCLRRMLAPQFFATCGEKLDEITAEVDRRHATGQPMLIGTQTIADSRRLSAALDEAGVTHAVLNGIQDAEEAAIIARAGEFGSVTVATNMAGRGTDIAVSDEALRVGGLHVIAVEFHESPRVDRQLIGRAARQGQPGSCQFFASADDSVFVHDPKLADRIRRRPNEDYSFDVASLQQRLEAEGFASRRSLIAQDQWLESVQSSLAKQN